MPIRLNNGVCFAPPRPGGVSFRLTPCSVHENEDGNASALVTLPDATSPDAFIKWAHSLPTGNPPTWLGLAPNAEAALLATRGDQLLSTWQVTRRLALWCVGWPNLGMYCGYVRFMLERVVRQPLGAQPSCSIV